MSGGGSCAPLDATGARPADRPRIEPRWRRYGPDGGLFLLGPRSPPGQLLFLAYFFSKHGIGGLFRRWVLAIHGGLLSGTVRETGGVPVGEVNGDPQTIKNVG